MICGMRLRWLIVVLALIVILTLGACEKKKTTEEVSPIDRVGNSPTATSQDVLHKTFTVRTTVAFPFEVPAHVAMPHLHGNFKSFVTKVGIQSNEHSADIDFLLLNEEQYTNFAAGNMGDAVVSMDASHDQAVDVSLPPSLTQSAKYYLIFRNTPGGDARKTVQADLTLDF